MPQIGAVVTIVAQEGQEEELIAVLGAMHAEVSAEPGCDLYRVVRLNRQPGTFVLLELYRDAEALAAHQTNAALARFGPALEPLTESMEVRLGTVLDLGADPASPWQNDAAQMRMRRQRRPRHERASLRASESVVTVFSLTGATYVRTS